MMESDTVTFMCLSLFVFIYSFILLYLTLLSLLCSRGSDDNVVMSYMLVGMVTLFLVCMVGSNTTVCILTGRQ